MGESEPIVKLRRNGLDLSSEITIIGETCEDIYSLINMIVKITTE